MSDIMKKSIGEVNPGVDIGRSTFTDLSFSHTTTLYEGDLVPIYLEEVLPGDSFSITTKSYIRMTTPIYPVMDNAYVDLFYFYVPNRLVWSHWKEFMGENTSAPWTQLTEYTVPQLKLGRTFIWGTNLTSINPRRRSIWNYFGGANSVYPIYQYDADGQGTMKTTTYSISDLPNRAYRLIWNEFFRSEAVEYPVSFYTDDSDRYYSVYDPDNSYENYGDLPLKVNRLFDYFSAVLPAPQQGPSVTAGLFNGTLPVVPVSSDFTSQISQGIRFARYTDLGVWSPTVMSTDYDSNLYLPKGTTLLRANVGSTSAEGETRLVAPYNLGAIANNVNLATVNQLRQSFAVQRYQEQLARSGNRYREQLKSFFGVTVPDSRVQVPEYLGGQRLPINIDQVLQTSSTDAVSPQGNTGAYSLTTATDASFTKSFVEHGMIIGLACIRVSHSYPQAVRPFLYRKNRFDFYFPQFANLGEQPVLKKVICPTGLPEIDDTVFGYNEAWADYRYRPGMLSGYFSPECLYNSSSEGIRQNISPLTSAWTYADHYDLNYGDLLDGYGTTLVTPPTLSKEWLNESDVNIQRTLAVQNEPQFLAQFYFDVVATRPMPVKSIPGLIDHH